jgi:hypothetical protein
MDVIFIKVTVTVGVNVPLIFGKDRLITKTSNWNAYGKL